MILNNLFNEIKWISINLYWYNNYVKLYKKGLKMHIHILGICGTFMAGIAVIARSLGHKVTGSDKNIYPPMSTLLEKEHIEIIEGYDPIQLQPAPDLVIIGNAMSRGNPCVEFILNNNIPYISAPQWLHDNVLRDRWVIAVAGTHGKTTTASMVNWILEKSNYQQGFMIGGVPGNFDISARLGEGSFFVIEADEYDCSFFDKRSKFMHYCPKTLILNNLEFDHADIFDDLSSIQKQFHHLVRLVPSEGLIISPQDDHNLKQVLAKGCWSQHVQTESDTGWKALKTANDASQFNVCFNNEVVGTVNYSLVGEHNMHNALMAIVAARNVGVAPKDACEALSTFINAKRRLELYGQVENVQIYDDFAHHPTAILATLEAIRSKVGGNRRILTVLEPRSNTMKLGVSKDEIAPSLGRADEVFIYQPEYLPWLVSDVVDECIQPAHWSGDLDLLVEMIVKAVKPNDVILVMSNGNFGGIHQKIIDKLIEVKEKEKEKL